MRPLLILLLAALSLACNRERPATPSSADAPVIVISIDTLRSDRLPAYGYEGVETPHLDRFRADSILFSRAYSHSPMTLPSHVSMLTGLAPNEHGVRNNLGYRYDADAHPPLTRALASNGYATGAAVSSYVLRGESGLAKAFDFYEDSIVPRPGAEFGEYQRAGGETAAFALPWIESQASRPFFFLFHIYEPHVPYDPPEPFRSRYASSPYDGEIAAADAIVGAFLDRLRQLGIYDRALIVITSDHGEGLGDHGEQQHSILIYREAIQVPLFVKLPENARRGTTVEQPVALSDIAPTVLEVANVGPWKTPARSLLEATAERAIYSETLYPRIHFGWSDLKSLVSGRYHYIESPRPELYDLVADPAEKTNLLATERRTGARLREALAGIPAGVDTLEQVSREEAGKLGSLGYLGRTAVSGSRENPVDQIGLLERMREAYLLAESRQYREAEEGLRALLAERPDLLDVRLRLAELLVENGRDADAIAQYDELLQRATIPLPDAMLASAALHLRTGRLDEAETLARAALGSHEARARELLARAALERGRLEEASREASALEATPEALVLRAEIAKAGGDLEGCLRLLDEAAEAARSQGRNVFRLDFVRGDALARLDRPDEAMRAYEREIASFPNDLDAYAGLAILQFVVGDRAKSERTLERMVRSNPTDRARALAAKTRAALRE
jgi:arylsulfatase A-like enzyme/tetratricopeptide (TPR) repeat protein